MHLHQNTAASTTPALSNSLSSLLVTSDHLAPMVAEAMCALLLNVRRRDLPSTPLHSHFPPPPYFPWVVIFPPPSLPSSPSSSPSMHSQLQLARWCWQRHSGSSMFNTSSQQTSTPSGWRHVKHTLGHGTSRGTPCQRSTPHTITAPSCPPFRPIDTIVGAVVCSRTVDIQCAPPPNALYLQRCHRNCCCPPPMSTWKQWAEGRADEQGTSCSHCCHCH